jgi:aminoglycoside phosphotransferase family enzyme/predicted kinase
MIVEDQHEAIEFLRRHAQQSGGSPAVVTTHISHVFLSGDRAFKMKRAALFPYLDFSTPEKRLKACGDEVDLNRRTAPDLYLGVRRLTRGEAGNLDLVGAGPLVEPFIEMRRFDEDCLLDNMARHGRLTPRIMTDLVSAIADLHRTATVSLDHGGAAALAAVIETNDQALRATGLIPASDADAMLAHLRRALDRHSPLLDLRRSAGKVRRCHGDLILRNICLLDGRPTLFDCIEFDETLATIDVLYDLAFLLMDLWIKGERQLANLVFNRYLDDCDEADGVALVPFFMAIRATVRAHVTATQAPEDGSEEAARMRRDALAHLDLANSLLGTSPPLCIAVGGLSGSGKSTTAAQLAPEIPPPPGARVLNSDRMRKRLHGVAPETRLPSAAYAPAVSQQVYDRLRQEAARTLANGWPVVVDAVFDRAEDRAAIEQLAKQAGIPFHGFWLSAPMPELASRIAARTRDPSDATTEVLAAQSQRDPGRIDWAVIDAGHEPDATSREISTRLGLAGCARPETAQLPDDVA